MAGEEELVLDAYQKLRKQHPQLKLVIAPRHPERFDSVEEILKQRHLAFVRRTRLLDERQLADVLLLDSIGELAATFQYADVVFMGGSLVPTGGHNILEPARYRKPIVFGPHMENFREMARLFLAAGAAIRLHKPSELAAAIAALLSNPRQASDLGTNAFKIVQQNSGATDRVLQVLQPAGARR